MLADAGALRKLRSAERAGSGGDYAKAAAIAAGIHREPAATRARLVEAYALRAEGRPAAALAAFRAAAAADPARASIHRDIAALLLARGDRRAAKAELTVALALDPRIELPPGVEAVGPR